jgi:hypothetical protein
MIRRNKRLAPSDSMAVHFPKARLRVLGKKRDQRLGSSFLAPELACEKILKGALFKKFHEIRKRLVYSSM